VAFWGSLLSFGTISLKVQRPGKTKLLIFVRAEQFLMSLLKLMRTWQEQAHMKSGPRPCAV